VLWLHKPCCRQALNRSLWRLSVQTGLHSQQLDCWSYGVRTRMAWATAVPGVAGHPGRADALAYVLLPRSSTVEVAAAPPAVRLRPELAFQLHKAPDPGAIRAEVGLDVGRRRLTEGGQVGRRAAPRTAPAAPRSAGPSPGRARSPPDQRIEHKFESGSRTLRSPIGPLRA
jgi:hypothetical protein